MTSQTKLLLEKDQRAREQALDVQESFIVQAPAGSGKTELLMQRFLSLLASAEKNPEEVLAITFTRKAASEMLARILAALEAADNPAPELPHAKQTWQLARDVLARDRALNWSLRENPHRLQIQTIDAFCAYLAARMPLRSRFGGSLSVTEQATPLYQAAAEQLLLTVGDNVPWAGALSRLIGHLDNRYGRLLELLIDLLSHRDQWLPYLYATAQKETDLRKLLTSALIAINEDLINDLEETIFQKSLDKGHDNSAKAILTTLLSFAAKHTPSSDCAIYRYQQVINDEISDPNTCQLYFWQAACELLLTKDSKCRKRLDASIGFPAPSSCKDKTNAAYFKTMKEKATEFLEACDHNPDFLNALIGFSQAPPTHYPEQQWQILADLIELLPIACGLLTLCFQEEGSVDFVEISLAALRALGEPEAPTDLALYLDYRIKHILVDEFQDTSITQFKLLEKLTADWYPNDGRTLFLVGDPMQSIYRFRQAEVGLFLRVKAQGIGQLKPRALTLHTNFRSDRPIVDWLNQSFSTLFPKTPDPDLGAINHSASVAFRSNDETLIQTVHLHLSLTSEEEAALITQRILSHRTRYPEHRIAILVRARSHLAALLPALSKEKLPYLATELNPLNENSLLIDLLTLTKALTHLGDRLAWLSLLRTPWVGLTLPDLTLVANHSMIIWEAITAFASSTAPNSTALTKEGHLRLSYFYERIKALRQQRGRLPLRDYIELAWLHLSGDRLITVEERKLIDPFFDLLDRYDQGGELIKHEEFIRAITVLYEKNKTSTQNPIEIMTIHKSKGLEFDAVFIPGLNQTPRPLHSPLLLFSEHTQKTGERDLVLAPIKSQEATNEPIYDYLQRQAKQKQARKCTGPRHVIPNR